MAQVKAKMSPQMMQQILGRAQDPQFIYKMHMAQLRATRIEYKGNAAMQTKLDAIEAKILTTYNATQKVIA